MAFVKQGRKPVATLEELMRLENELLKVELETLQKAYMDDLEERVTKLSTELR
jgi:hypothetical protein